MEEKGLFKPLSFSILLGSFKFLNTDYPVPIFFVELLVRHLGTVTSKLWQTRITRTPLPGPALPLILQILFNRA